MYMSLPEDGLVYGAGTFLIWDLAGCEVPVGFALEPVCAGSEIESASNRPIARHTMREHISTCFPSYDCLPLSPLCPSLLTGSTTRITDAGNRFPNSKLDDAVSRSTGTGQNTIVFNSGLTISGASVARWTSSAV